jgi:acid phosphatase (class A)
VDWVAFVGDYPHPGSPGAEGDTAVLLWLQHTRTREDVLRAEGEVIPRIGLFSGVVGADLDSSRYPLTRALLAAANTELHGVMGTLKRHFARPRPYVEDARIKPAVGLEASYAYPSGHSGWGVVEAGVLAELVPARQEAILERGRLVGNDRVMAGVHHPSDVEAGQRLGAALVAAWLRDPIRRNQVEAARAAEW